MTISHLKQIDSDWLIQTNEEHSKGVASLARDFTAKFGFGSIGYIMGMLHDKGKEKHDFQKYIRVTSGYDPNAGSWHDKSHAYVGGLIAKEMYPKIFSLLGNPIMGHHRGLYDYIDLERECEKDIPKEVSSSDIDEAISLPSWFRPNVLQENDIHHVERMLYSCLVDADFLDTERFMQPEEARQRGSETSLAALLPKLNEYLAHFGEPTTDVNKIRCEVQQACKMESQGEKGFYSLTVPTGGGKTLSSLVWALRHAVCHGMKRIIISIPYTSIIVQTASILKEIFGPENVLEHHSNFDYENVKDDKLRSQYKLATENWDYPIIVTTNVQLFESMFSNKPSDCRKLHNICNSVIILDEVQTLPTGFLQPIVDTLKTYQKIFGVSVLFTTASQPILGGTDNKPKSIIEGCNPRTRFEGVEHIREIIPNGLNLHEKLRRVKLSIDNEAKTYDEIAEQLSRHQRVLCIVNTRKDAKEIFDRLPKEGVTLHLSRMMCPDHVNDTIAKVKDALKDDRNSIIRVVATQLIEAGVDIDFPVVYRQEAGLDSVLQAAGRCNREGKNGICTTYVFTIKGQIPYGTIKDGNNARISLDSDSDWFAPSTMTNYFEQLYCRCDTFDAKDIKHYLYKPKELMFDTAALIFHLIDDNTTPVIINWKESLELVEQLKAEGPSYRLMKKLSKYSVNVRKGDLKKLAESGTIETLIEGIFVIRDSAQYSKDVGLLSDNHWLEEIHII